MSDFSFVTKRSCLEERAPLCGMYTASHGQEAARRTSVFTRAESLYDPSGGVEEWRVFLSSGMHPFVLRGQLIGCVD